MKISQSWVLVPVKAPWVCADPAAYWRPRSSRKVRMPRSRRVDPDDGAAYTWEEFSTYYKGKYKKKAVEEY